jgi:hypothetical protein
MRSPSQARFPAGAGAHQRVLRVSQQAVSTILYTITEQAMRPHLRHKQMTCLLARTTGPASQVGDDLASLLAPTFLAA